MKTLVDMDTGRSLNTSLRKHHGLQRCHHRPVEHQGRPTSHQGVADEAVDGRRGINLLVLIWHLSYGRISTSRLVYLIVLFFIESNQN
ncbi:hypothetical protein HRI_000926100 [Hibiscus trionum]|uniref:Uncharacterized protein n=1 Tax=Hibiscus trionum TaxID=183268 RepID=A0A9W7H8C9_HIBTR|nr:hypothetical protein HRI_000926100 [Hibiscus trionum]